MKPKHSLFNKIKTSIIISRRNHCAGFFIVLLIQKIHSEGLDSYLSYILESSKREKPSIPKKLYFKAIKKELPAEANACGQETWNSRMSMNGKSLLYKMQKLFPEQKEIILRQDRSIDKAETIGS